MTKQASLTGEIIEDKKIKEMEAIKKAVTSPASDFLPDHIEEYAKNSQRDSNFIEIFEATEDDVDIKTELGFEELILVNKINMIDKYLEDKLGSAIYNEFLNGHMRLKISKDRMSRKEFVEINRKDNLDKNLERLSNFSNIAKVKE